MAKPLKDYFDENYALFLSEKIKATLPSFDAQAFVLHMSKLLLDEPFLKRQDLYVDGLEIYLKLSYKEALDCFEALWGEPLQQETGMFKEGFWLWPLARYVERHGLLDIDRSFIFIEGLTMRHTGEFAIRPLLIHETKATMAILETMSQSDNVHVRRLASEGMRIALPWAKKTTAALSHLEIYTLILTRLKEDTSKFVLKSVGNNLNDLYQVDASLAQTIIDTWQKTPLSNSAKWVIKHGQRRLNA